VTVYSEDIGNIFGVKRILDRLEPARLIVEVAQIVAQEGDEPDALADLTPKFWPAKTWLRFTFRPLKQIRPHWVTVNVLS
jgi:hypothetical protein